MHAVNAAVKCFNSACGTWHACQRRASVNINVAVTHADLRRLAGVLL